MDQFTSTKLGEILAFAEVEIETWEKGKDTLAGVLGEEEVEKTIKSSREHKDLIHSLANRAKVLVVVETKLESSGGKLRAMRDLYIGDQWQNPTELLEWSGFFEGASIVHASLLSGLAAEEGHEELKSFAKEFLSFHTRIFNEVSDHLMKLGREKSRGN